MKTATKQGTETGAVPRATADDAETILACARRILDLEAAGVVDARTRLDQAFVDATRAILECTGRVCVTGVGKAGLVGNKIQATLASTGTLAYGLHPVEALHGDLGMIHADDCIIALSKSGSSELIELLPRLRQLGCRIILITARVDSPAAEHADVVLDIGSTPEACPLGLAPSSSTTAMLALGDALALTVMELKAIKPEQYAGYHPGGALGRFLLTAGEIMRTGPDCPTVKEGDTLGECYRAILAAPRRAGAAMVVDDDGKLIGIVTHGDFFRLLQSPDRLRAERPIAEVMVKNPKRILREARCHEALPLMHKHGIDELPVVDDAGKLTGLIDIQDLIARGFSALDGP